MQGVLDNETMRSSMGEDATYRKKNFRQWEQTLEAETEYYAEVNC